MGKLVVGVAGGTGVALAHVQRQEACQQATILIEGGQALDVIGVVDVRVLRMQANEALGGGSCGFRLGILVVGVDQFQLGLLGIAAERITRFERLELGYRACVTLVIQIALRLLVQLGLAQVLVEHLVGRAGSGKGEDGDQQQVSHLHGGLRPCDGGCLEQSRPVMMSAPGDPGAKTRYLTTSA
ncbi:hypothetical protein D3C84_559200 [compost metagenome]